MYKETAAFDKAQAAVSLFFLRTGDPSMELRDRPFFVGFRYAQSILPAVVWRV
jgi:hypothetical protein